MDRVHIRKDLLREVEKIAAKLGLSSEKALEFLVDWYFVREWLISVFVVLKVKGIDVVLDDRAIYRIARAIAFNEADVIDLGLVCLIVVPSDFDVVSLVPDFYEKKLNKIMLILVEKKSFPLVLLLPKTG